MQFRTAGFKILIKRDSYRWARDFDKQEQFKKIFANDHTRKKDLTGYHK